MMRLIKKITRPRWLLFLVILVLTIMYSYNLFFNSFPIVKGTSRRSGVRNGGVPKEKKVSSKNGVNKGGFPIEKLVGYVIFDASGFNGNLEFLNHREHGWRVLVVNLADDNRLLSCESCSLLRSDTITPIYNKLKHLIDKGELDSKGLTLLAAIILAVTQKASWIYITNRPAPIPYKAFKRVTKIGLRTGLVYQGQVLEPCSHFMDPFMWNGLGVQPVGNRFNLRQVAYHSVYYVLNECFRKDMSQQDWEKSLDTRAPIPHTMPGTFAAVDFKNMLVSKPNAWSLIASVMPDDKENTNAWSRSQIVNLMVQRVLWETQSNVGVLSDIHNVEKGCPTCNLHSRLYQFGKYILANLTRWRCENTETVPKCLVKLAMQYDNMHIQHLISSWITILEEIGDESIKRIALNDGRLEAKTKGLAVHFTPAKSLHKSTTGDTRPPNAYEQICNIDGKPYVAKIPAQHKEEFEGILLILIYNFGKTVRNIPFMEYTHGRHFKHIIHCSDNLDIFTSEFQKQFNVNPVSFIEATIGTGRLGQNCMTAVMEMGFDVKGYLQVGDDVLVNTWNYFSLPYDKPWFQAKFRVAKLDADRVPCVWKNKNWLVWYAYAGKARNAFKRIQQEVTHPKNGLMTSQFLKNIANITRCDYCIVYETSDIVYVPQRLVSKFSYFINFFTEVHLEIAFPTVLVGISSDTEIFRLRGNYLWFNERVMYPFVWTEFNHFHHSFKLIDANKEDVKFYCQQFLSRLDKDI